MTKIILVFAICIFTIQSQTQLINEKSAEQIVSIDTKNNIFQNPKFLETLYNESPLDRKSYYLNSLN